MENSDNYILLSRAGGGIWPDETQQPTVIPLWNGAHNWRLVRNGANSNRKRDFLIDKRGEVNLQTSFVVERGFLMMKSPNILGGKQSGIQVVNRKNSWNDL